jgi:transposase
MGKRSIQPYIRAQAVALYQSGLNLSKISEQLKVSRCCVQNAITKFEQHGIFEDLKRSGRPKALSERNVRELKRLVTGDNRLSVGKITSNLNGSLQKPVSKDTVRRCIRKLGYEYCVKIKKPWLSAKHKKARIEWCKQHQHWTICDWRKVIFSDESTFYVLKRKNQVKVWRTDDERLLPECVQQMNTGNGGKLGIWGGISGEGTTMARIFDDSMNGILYCDVLQNELKKSIARFPKKMSYMFQQDLAPWHTSKLVSEKIAKMRLNMLEWAPKSPDLNPVEMLWSILDKKLCQTHIYKRTTSRTAGTRME